MKKIVALCTVWILLLTICPVFNCTVCAAAQVGKLYFEKDFEDSYYGIKAPFDNMTTRPNGNSIGTDVESDGNRYMFFKKYSPDYAYATGEGNSNFEKILSNAVSEEKIVIQFDLKPKDSVTKMAVQLTDNANSTYNFWLEGSKVCGVENVLKTDGWTKIRAFYDFGADVPYIKVYADNTEIMNKTIGIKNFWRVRFHSEKSYAAGTYCFDNFAIYSGEPIFDDSLYELSYSSAVDADNNDIKGVSALSVYGDYYIGGTKGKDTNIIKCENDGIYISGKRLSALLDIEVSADTYMPYSEALASLGKTAVYDDRGFIYWSESEETLELTDSQKWMIHNILMYDRPTSEILTQNVKKSHPRLSIPEGRINEIKQEILENEYAEWYFRTSKTRIDDYYNAALLNDESNTNTVMMKARALLLRVKNLAIWYHLMEDENLQDAEEYEIKENVKTKIWENVEAVINDEDFPHWQPNSGLDNAEMAAAVSYAYDWLYDEWSAEQKKAMEEALYKKALVYAVRNYGGQIGGNSSWWVNARNSNQNAVINGGYILCALSIIDKYPKEAGFVLEKAIRSVEHFQNSFYPDGAWLEGTTYWTYSMQYWVPAVSSIKISYGTDFGLTRAPGLSKSPEYIMHVSSINQNNNYHDSELNTSVYYMGSFYGLAKLYDEPSWADWALTYNWHHQVYYGMTTLIFFSKSAKVLEDIGLPKDAAIKRDGVGAFRENWLDENGMYLSYHGGYAYPGHGHCDTGTFVYEYDGVRFATDLPSESYSYSGNLLDVYRTRPEGHNCLVINPDTTPGHNTSAFSPIEKFETNDYGGFGILNMTDLYESYASGVRRGFKTDDNRNSMIIRDEIKGIKKGGKVYWFMHTYADTTIEIKDKGTAVLTRSGKSIKLEFLTDAQGFEIKEMAAQPLETSPQLIGQSDNGNYKKIAFIADCTESSDMYIQAKLSPAGDDIMPAENIELDKWQTDSFTETAYKKGEYIRFEIGDKDLFPVIALYKGGKLFKIIPAKNNSYDGMTAMFEQTEDSDFCAKFFVWDSAEKLKPLTDELSMKVQKMY